MSYNFLPYEQDQLLLMPPSLAEWVSEDSLARFVSELVDAMQARGELAAFFAAYRADGWGRAAYHPCLMIKVLLYCYAVGVRSSRRIAQTLEHDIAVRYLAANRQPDFRTIADFRTTHLAALEQLFGSVLALCRDAGLAEMGVVALDGRRVAANAALDQNRKQASLEREIAAILAEAERVDREEDAQYGIDVRGDELPEGLRTTAERRERLTAALDRLAANTARARAAQAAKIEARVEEERRTGKKKRGPKPTPPEAVGDPDKTANTTDPESRIMQSRRGWLQGYNAQAMTDSTSQVIVAQTVTQDENDLQQLAPMLAQVQANTGAVPKACTADAGYWTEANAALESGATELFIATTKHWKRKQELAKQGPPRGRIAQRLTPQERMERKLRTKRGQAIYRLRGCSVEAVFGQMEGRGLNRFWLRGLRKVQGEWSLFCSTHNILKLWRLAGATAALATG
jgi:transposase/IS5 family transposase